MLHSSCCWGHPRFNQDPELRRNARCLPWKVKCCDCLCPQGAFKMSLHSSGQMCAEYDTCLCTLAMEDPTNTHGAAVGPQRSLGHLLVFDCFSWVTLRVRASETDGAGEHFFTTWSRARTRLSSGTCDTSSAQIWNTCIIYAKCRTSEKKGGRGNFTRICIEVCTIWGEPFVAVKLINERQKFIC